MSTYVFCPRKSEGAFELVKALGAVRLRRFDGMDFWDKNRRFKLSPEDAIICWGANCPDLDGVRVLNGSSGLVNKYEEIMTLSRAGVPTIGIFPKNPGRPGWYARTENHIGGSDLLSGLVQGDYWVQRDTFVNEYRIHSFAGRSLRAGRKVIREGFRPMPESQAWRPDAHMAHPWIKSFDGGWRIRYDGFQSTAAMRSVAHMAVKALGLTFGAVDIGEKEDGTFRVFEVNRAPGIEGNTIASYAEAIGLWLKGELNEVRGTRKRKLRNPQDEGL